MGRKVIKAYFVPDDNYGQHGSEIEEFLIVDEFGTLSADSLKKLLENYGRRRGGFACLDYECALYATQD